MIRISKWIFIVLCVCFISLGVCRDVNAENEYKNVNTDWEKISLESNESIVIGVELIFNDFTDSLSGMFLEIDDSSIKIQSTDFNTIDRVPVDIIMTASKIEQKGRIVRFRFNKEDVVFIALSNGSRVYAR